MIYVDVTEEAQNRLLLPHGFYRYLLILVGQLLRLTCHLYPHAYSLCSTDYLPIRGSRSKLLQDKVLVNCQYSMATFSTSERKRRPRGDRKSQEMTMHLQQTFNAAILTSLHPRSQIDIFVEVLQSDGGNYCASVNAATLAVIDAGIPMKDYVCACSASYLGDSPIVDINYLEESSGSPEITVAVLPKSEQIVFLEMNGRLHEDNLSKVVDMAVKGCKDVYGVLDRTVREHVSQVGSSLET